VSTPLSVSAIVSRFAGLKQLTERAQRLRELDRVLVSHLPLSLAAHVRLATVRDGCVVVHADGSTWAAELRFKTPDILANLRQHPDFQDIVSLRVRNIAHHTAATETAVCAHRTLSSRAADALAAQARTTLDHRLAAALEKLSRRRGG
jgi:hypothetical protein